MGMIPEHIQAILDTEYFMQPDALVAFEQLQRAGYPVRLPRYVDGGWRVRLWAVEARSEGDV